MKTIHFEADPSSYQHWTLEIRDAVATLAMNVREDGGLQDGYTLKLNSYDLGVDIELADAVQRLRFSHPEVRVLVITSLRERIFCAGANIMMLGQSSHPFKVNFCKFTNETRLALEDLSAYSGVKTLCALNGTASGGGYELALACDYILLVDDGNSAVSLPEVPLLGVLPGTGGLTRLVDKRKVRRDLADFFSTTAEGVRGRRTVEWNLVDEITPRTHFAARMREKAAELARASDRPKGVSGIELEPIVRRELAEAIEYRYVHLAIERGKRVATLTVKAPDAPQPEDPAGFVRTGSSAWALQAWRELDDALLHLRFNEPTVGVVLVKTEGDPKTVLAADQAVARHQEDWLVREILLHQKRVLKRLDLTARTFFAIIEPSSAFAGSLFELALAADRSYMLNAADQETTVELSALNHGLLPMSSGLSRLAVRFLGNPGQLERVLAHQGAFAAEEALEAGLVTFAPDELDWEDEVRLAIEERATMSPDALTGMEANFRFAGPETLETKIFGRLSAWQNWIFTRKNATGEKGALTVYGKTGERPEFDFTRT
jgi:benzoyl-CoA-dihydrodiol lyase